MIRSRDTAGGQAEVVIKIIIHHSWLNLVLEWVKSTNFYLQVPSSESGLLKEVQTKKLYQQVV